MEQRESPKVQVSLTTERKAALKAAPKAVRDVAEDVERLGAAELRDVIGGMAVTDLRTAVYVLVLQVRDVERRLHALERRG